MRTENSNVHVSTCVEVRDKPAAYTSGAGALHSSDVQDVRKVAFITGTTGQDGSYLVELLLSKGEIISTECVIPLI